MSYDEPRRGGAVHAQKVLARPCEDSVPVASEIAAPAFIEPAVALVACEQQSCFGRDSGPFPSCCGPQPALKRSCRSDRVTRDWPATLRVGAVQTEVYRRRVSELDRRAAAAGEVAEVRREVQVNEVEQANVHAVPLRCHREERLVGAAQSRHKPDMR